jgi:hypothetical protein
MASLPSSANVTATRSDGTSFPARDRAMILLSVKTGSRACELAKLDRSMVLDARGKVADTLAVRDVIAKERGSGASATLG